MAFREIGRASRSKGVRVRKRRMNQLMMATADNQRAFVESPNENPALPRRILALENIATPELRLLLPRGKELVEAHADRNEALSIYADRLRINYKENEDGFRDGLRLLSETLEGGQSINISCSCRGGELCHADVVKMAIEKVSDHLKLLQKPESEPIRATGHKSPTNAIEVPKANRPQKTTNPRTMRAIAEILGVSQSDRLLESINQTDGRNRSEHASYLGTSSQFVRDLYERGANIIDGKLIVPQEKPEISRDPAIVTNEYAVKKIEKILGSQSKGKEFAPLLVEYGNKIAGRTSDGETKIKVFSWMYEALDGKSNFLSGGIEGARNESSDERFGRQLEAIRNLAEEMHQLEPTDRVEVQTLQGNEQTDSLEIIPDEGLSIENIYEEAISVVADEALHSSPDRQSISEELMENEPGARVSIQGFDRIELESRTIPQIPTGFETFRLERLFANTLPEIDRQIESGVSKKDVLKPYRENVYQSAKDDALNKLETIYQKEQITNLKHELAKGVLATDLRENVQTEITAWQTVVLTPTQEDIRQILLEGYEIDDLAKMLAYTNPNRDEAELRLNELRDREISRKESNRSKTVSQLSEDPRGLGPQVKDQLKKYDVHRPLIISLSAPAEIREVQEAAENKFFQVKQSEIRLIRAELAELRGSKNEVGDKNKESDLKKAHNNLEQLRFSVSYKLENSSKIVTGEPSEKTREELIFFTSYVDHQLKQPESRLRHENERYRTYAAKLEKATSRIEILDAASEIRAENARLGLNWKDLPASEKQKQPRPLTAKEMQFLFTEASPAHYSPEMTVARLAYAHAGSSRRLMADALINGEIKPSKEAQKLVDSLESRLDRKEIRDSISATRHFFESIRNPDADLRYKNSFDHQEVYRKLPPPEKDFVYRRAVQQKENLEYRQVFHRTQPAQSIEVQRKFVTRPELTKTEKSFHLLSQFNQARILGDRIESPALHSQEITPSDFKAVGIILNNNSTESVEQISHELRKAENGDHRRAAEILETFAKAEIKKEGPSTTIQITVPGESTIAIESYKELLEKLHPSDEHESDKYRLSNFSRESIEGARTLGQDETIKNWLRDLEDRTESSPLAAVEGGVRTEEQLKAIANLQEIARSARTENELIIAKYVSRTASKLQAQKRTVPTDDVRRHLTETALGAAPNSSAPLNTANRHFFQEVQKEITITDFRRFEANRGLLDQKSNTIREKFAGISIHGQLQTETKPRSLKLKENDNLAERGQESKNNSTPLSLQLYEAEILRAEKELLSKSLTERLSKLKDSVGSIDKLDPQTLFSQDEREQIRASAAGIAKERLEPKELDANHRSVSADAAKQAIATFKQLDASCRLYLYTQDKTKINQSFALLDKEAATLHRIRHDYTRAERLAMLTTGVKADLVDLVRRNAGTKGSDLIEQTANILDRNIEKSGEYKFFSSDFPTNVLSREIGDKIDGRQQLLYREDTRADNHINTRDPAMTSRTSAQNSKSDLQIKVRVGENNIYVR